MINNFWNSFKSVYFIGIGGVSMSALAKYALIMGKKVAGSDKSANIFTDELCAAGIEICIGNENDSVGKFDLIVYTDAVNENNIQLTEAKRLRKDILSRGQFLYEVSRNFKKIIAVSGCHGKTTCSSMIAHIFNCASQSFCAHIGGRDLKYKNFYYCGDEYLITEACEYKKNFLLLKPDIAVILNTDPDHLECYGSVENLLSDYKRFAECSEIAITQSGDFKCGEYITFGFSKRAMFYAGNIKEDRGFYSFNIFDRGDKLGYVSLNVYGKHNILNALAAAAAARSAGIGFEYIAKGLKEFTGVERRFENIGVYNGADCIADYAHHPNEIRVTLDAVKKISCKKLYVIFQPHTYSRTKNLFEDFVRVLLSVKHLMIYKTYAAREYFDDAGSALTLSQRVKKSKYGDNLQDIFEFIAQAGKGDIIIFLGAGDIYDLAKIIVGGSL